jgi:drug/metabolite transporter (DMT)-like permease
MPVVGIVLGGVVLHEAVDPRLLLGAALIIGGIVLVNRQGGWPVAFRRTRRTFATDGGRG